MKRILILGSNIIGLYNAMKYYETDFVIDIIDKKCNMHLDTVDNYIYNLYNDNHKSYINLLKKFNITSIPLSIKYNERIYNIINIVIEKVKLLPYNVYLSYSFIDLCKCILTNTDYDILNKELNYSNILNCINAYDFINIFTNDLSKKINYYYITNDNINLLITKMINHLTSNKNIKIYYNLKCQKLDFNYDTNIFLFNNNEYDYVVCTFSKKNIIELNIWNTKQKNLLNNSVYNINLYNIKNFIDILININVYTNLIENKTNINNILLNQLQVVYPQNNYKIRFISLWNININSNTYFKDKNKEKIKFLFNNKLFISNLCYCKNNLFINYVLDDIDCTSFIKLKKKK